ncbi:hypothetical protein D9757_006148 [Collybiopsis confluens]|uniref:Protein kinase domain-containing protein n=1 Tax=Collybiopsis confluens TaxID=2823264 RepID=A0A8H5HHQ8_9AGAR|nr:hypothetical protein D9757_006148 [Collybiopsis confluens]
MIRFSGNSISAKLYVCLIAKLVRTRSEEKFYKAQLRHPNVVKCQAIIPTHAWSIVVLLELVSLESPVDAKGSFAFSTIRNMSRNLARVFDFLHRSGIAHMDIKPSNLVYHPTTFVLHIIDFKLAVKTEPYRSEEDSWLDCARFKP